MTGRLIHKCPVCGEATFYKEGSVTVECDLCDFVADLQNPAAEREVLRHCWEEIKSLKARIWALEAMINP